MNKLIMIFFVGLLLNSCTKKVGPESFLKDFVKYRFTENQSVEDLLSMSAESLNERISNLSEEDKLEYLDSSKRKFGKLKIDLVSCVESKESCNITYTLSYNYMGDDKAPVLTQTKKIALLKKIDEKWKIAEVDEVKTYIEGKKPISPLSP